MGLRITKAALLAFLKKNRPSLHTWSASKNLKKGITEKNYLQWHATVRGGMGLKPKTNPDTNFEKLIRLTLPDMPSMKRHSVNIENIQRKKRKKVAKAATRYRKKGGKLSEYNTGNPVYQKVDALRKIKAKQEKKTGTIY